MKQEVVFTRKTGDIKSVADDLCGKLKNSASSYNAVIFFASSDYDVPALSVEIKTRFPDAEVIGTSTSGEISSNGFTKKSIVMTAFSCTSTRISTVLVEDVDKFPIIHKEKIISAMRKCGISENDPKSHETAFALTFINGLRNAEEALLSLFYAIVKNDRFLIAGGSAGDDLKFKETYVCCNGKTVSSGAVIMFFKTSLKFDIRKENIYKPSGKQLRITNADTTTRTIYTINNRPAKSEYASSIGIPEYKVNDALLDYPFGRVFGDNIFISSLASFNPNGSINMYSRVLQNSQVDLLEPDDYKTITAETCNQIKEKIKNPQFVLLINCILRTITFENKACCSTLTDMYNAKFPVFCGFSSYGEQYGLVNSNQTLVTIVIGE